MTESFWKSVFLGFNWDMILKLPTGYKIKTDKDGKQRVVQVVDPRLDASAKIRQRTSKKQRPVKRAPV